jgi:hypothetical protein
MSAGAGRLAEGQSERARLGAMASLPAFQHQGPDSNCVIEGAQLGWVSCTAYSMAMLIDAATDGVHRPKGCKIRRGVTPKDIVRGLTLRQCANVAERDYDVVVSVRTGPNAIPVAKAIQRIQNGRGFLLQGNNEAFGKSPENHAIYVHKVRGGTPGAPAEALVFDPQRFKERWIPWTKVLAFGAGLRLNKSGTLKLGPGRLYAGFMPRQLTPAEALVSPPVQVSGVKLRFGAEKLPRRRRTKAIPPPGKRVNVRSSPQNLAPANVIDTLEDGELFVAYQRVETNAVPPGASTKVWLGNKDGTEWVHRSGVVKIGVQT